MLGAGVISGLAGLSAAIAQDAPTGNVANGKKLYTTIGCSQCHGFVGQGGAAGPKLIDPTPFPAFIAQLRTPRQVMPPYTERVLSDQQVADIYAHVKTFPLPPDPSTLSILK
jgi:ubiquinol-cytochrome c reductase cytochrome c subunit